MGLIVISLFYQYICEMGTIKKYESLVTNKKSQLKRISINLSIKIAITDIPEVISNQFSPLNPLKQKTFHTI